jgi:outer membrane immunogenic protein
MRLLSVGLGLAVSFALGVSSARAADLYGSVKDAPVEVYSYSWTGTYGGVHLGGGWGNADITENLPNIFGILPPSISSQHDVEGMIGGIHLGMNRQYGNLVVGAELRLSGSDISGSNGDCLGLTTFAAGIASVECATSVNWMGSAMAKLGYAWDRFLVYGNVGWAVAGVDHHLTAALNPAIAPLAVASAVNETADGIAFGGGIEFAATPNIILGIEYTHTELEARGSGLLLGGALTTGNRNIDLDEVKARLSFKFGG